MEPFSTLEIVIKKSGQKYKASCLTFPHCHGVGDSQEDAIKKLTDAISNFISGLAKKAFNTVLLSDKYSEVILDSSKKDEQRRVFSLDPTLQNLSKTIFIRLEKKDIPTRKINAKDIKNLLQNSSPLVANHNPMDTIDQSMSTNRSLQPQDTTDIVFGFPLSLN